MENKIVFIGLIVALLLAASAENANPELYTDDVPLTIYVDAGWDIDQFLTLAKSIDGKQSVLEDAREGTLIDKRFVLTTANCLHANKFTTVEFFSSDPTVSIKVKIVKKNLKFC
ncbi:PREDICTED: uncharacterized protein LOC108972364 [Bactrocera latifrons]|uniref:uncharacterized protein LOC108972364 n=1 Tax=Bactrocera latifrons TaxID=174628 RepID=UPI0008DD3A51|nr:PREDICTED: uncharacterized protein LOC108972364 [Bactrocera latifrons]